MSAIARLERELIPRSEPSRVIGDVSTDLPFNTDAARDIETRVEQMTRGTDLSQVAALLAEQRDEILRRWLEATAAQPFHVGRYAGAIADHIPELFDALVALMQRSAPRWVTPGPPLDDPAVLSAARAHAQRRFEQGLAATDIVAEFRLLRQEIGRALRLHIPSNLHTEDAVGAELLVHDALDGAISLALAALTRQIEELREEFLATLVHDLRQPTATIKGHQQLVLRGLAAPVPDIARTRDLLGRAQAQSDRLGRLVDQLADASRVALGRLEVRPARHDLLALLHNVVKQLEPASVSRIQVDVSPDTLDTHGEFDAELVERVVANLLSNAVKYSPPNSPIHMALAEQGDALHLSIRDIGIGLTPDEIATLFKRYSRARGAVEQGVQGLGLGLFLSRGVVEAHGGRIWAESAGKGQGTTFHML